MSGRRRKAATAFASTIVSLLADLALEHTQFDIRFNPSPLPEAEWSPLGLDRAEFYVSPNPGEDLRPLARIVSGGELSRIMLALKTMTFGARLAASHDERDGARVPGVGAPGMIFDEVDAGIGGRVADVVGKRLRQLGSTCQVLCITHLPQVASNADTHFLIEKRIDGNRTRTHVTRLDAEGRVDEMARMLAGASTSEAVRASAREMLARAGHRAGGESERRIQIERRKRKSARRKRGRTGVARKYLIETFGCQMNVHDSERMAGLLEQAGYEATADAGDADLVVINTCSVRERAEEKLFTRLGELRMLGAENGHAPARGRRRLRGAAGRSGHPEARARRRRPHRRDAGDPASADAGRRGGAPASAGRSISPPTRMCRFRSG